jgi:hypothetical protein
MFPLKVLTNVIIITAFSWKAMPGDHPHIIFLNCYIEKPEHGDSKILRWKDQENLCDNGAVKIVQSF